MNGQYNPTSSFGMGQLLRDSGGRLIDPLAQDPRLRETPPQTESPGQRAFMALAGAISELDTRMDRLEKRLTPAMSPRGAGVTADSGDKCPQPIQSELVSTIEANRARIDGLIARVTSITDAIDL